MAWRDWEQRPVSRPRAVRGGIRAHAQRGSFTQQWWGRRWLEVLESLAVGGRLGRGRSYARAGQVADLTVGRGEVRARVQGSRPDPYEVVIIVRPLAPDQWSAVVRALEDQAGHVARLLAGEMPREIESVFQQAGVPLFPTTFRELQTTCSCPDDSNPCKHIAAVYYLLGEAFDRDPFLILGLRGLPRPELMERLGVGGGTGSPETTSPLPPAVSAPLDADPSRFWRMPVVPPDLIVAAPPTGTPDSVLQRFGRFPFWRGRRSPQEALAPVYRVATRQALETFAGDGSASGHAADDDG